MKAKPPHPMTEHFTQECLRCKVPIDLEWNNGLLPGDYVLIADWVYHPECWQAMLEEWSIEQ